MIKVFQSLVLATMFCLAFSSAGLAAGGGGAHVYSTPDPAFGSPTRGGPAFGGISEIFDPSPEPASLFIYIYNQPFQGEWLSTDRDIFVEVDSFLEALGLSESESSALKEKFRSAHTVEKNGTLFVSLRSAAKILHGKVLKNPGTGVVDFTRFYGAYLYQARQESASHRQEASSSPSAAPQYSPPTTPAPPMGYSSPSPTGLYPLSPAIPALGYPAPVSGYSTGFYPGYATFFPAYYPAGYGPAVIPVPCNPPRLPHSCSGTHVFSSPSIPHAHCTGTLPGAGTILFIK